MELRPYQKECIDIIDNLDEGRYLVVLATGLGKTVVFANIKRKGRTLILSHRDELVRQPEKYFDCSFGVEKAEEHSNGEEVVSASVQTLSRDGRLEGFSPDEFHTIIIDEAHHAAAPTYKKIINYFSGAKLLIGVTATPKRGDSVKLSDVFDKIVYTKDLRWGIENGYLSHLRCERVYADYDLKHVKMSAGDFNQLALEKELEKQKVISMTAKAYITECHKTGKHTLIYCVTKKICGLLLDTIRDLLPEEERDSIRVLTGDTPDDERKQILDGFMDGSIRCIINCMVLTEGTDLPVCDAVVNLRPTCNTSLYQQMVGRGTRLYDGKEYCLVVDIVPDGSAVKRSLCTAPVLFGVEPELLNQKVLEKLDKDVDLLDFCSNIADSYAAGTKHLQLIIQSYDAFLEEQEQLIMDNKKNGYTGIARARRKKTQDLIGEEAGSIFGDLDVFVQADENRYYTLYPDYKDEITFSKPDIMGNTNVDFHVDGSNVGMNGKHHFSGEMKMEDAVELAKHYCEILPDYAGYAWSRKQQEVWSKMPATDAQYKKLSTEMRNYGIRQSQNSVSKLDASTLIDMMERTRQKKQFLSNFGTSGCTDKAKKKKEDLFQKAAEAEQKMIEKDKSMFPEFVKRVENMHEKAEAGKAARQKRNADIMQKKCFKAIISVLSAGNNQRASDAQVKFALSLVARARCAGFILPKGMYVKELGKQEIAVLIDMFKFILDNGLTGNGKTYVISADDIYHAFARVRKFGRGTYSDQEFHFTEAGK